MLELTFVHLNRVRMEEHVAIRLIITSVPVLSTSLGENVKMVQSHINCLMSSSPIILLWYVVL